MENSAVNPRGAKFTDEQLREDLLAGLRPVDIARKYNVSRAAVSKRVNQLELTTTAAAVSPQESKRFVRSQINAMEQLTRSLQRVNLLMDACDEWLRDAGDPEKYSLEPRCEEVDVTYNVEIDTGERLIVQKRKKKLNELLALIQGETDSEGGRIIGWVHGEHKRADPRELILKTATEARQTVSTAADLAKMLVDIRVMTAFRDAVVSEIAKVEPEVASRIVEAIERSHVLHGLIGEPAPVRWADLN